MKIVFGRKYLDSQTGFEGIATARVEYWKNAEEILLETLDNEGRILKEWVETARLKEVV